MPAESKLIACSAGADLAGLSESTFRRAHRNGDLPAGIVVTLNGRLYVRRAALLAWLNGERSPEQPEPLRAVDGGRR